MQTKTVDGTDREMSTKYGFFKPSQLRDSVPLISFFEFVKGDVDSPWRFFIAASVKTIINPIEYSEKRFFNCLQSKSARIVESYLKHLFWKSELENRREQNLKVNIIKMLKYHCDMKVAAP